VVGACPATWNLLGLLRELRGDVPELALQAFVTAADLLGPPEDALNTDVSCELSRMVAANRARALVSCGLYEDAAASYTALLKQDEEQGLEKDVPLSLGLAFCLARANKIEASKAVYTEVLQHTAAAVAEERQHECDADVVEQLIVSRQACLFSLARLHFLQNDTQQALQMLEQGCQDSICISSSSPTCTSTFLLNLHAAAAALHVHTSDIPGALLRVQHFTAALDDAVSRNLLPDECVKERVVERCRLLAHISFADKDREQARRWLARACHADPTRLGVWVELGSFINSVDFTYAHALLASPLSSPTAPSSSATTPSSPSSGSASASSSNNSTSSNSSNSGGAISDLVKGKQEQREEIQRLRHMCSAHLHTGSLPRLHSTAASTRSEGGGGHAKADHDSNSNQAAAAAAKEEEEDYDEKEGRYSNNSTGTVAFTRQKNGMSLALSLVRADPTDTNSWLPLVTAVHAKAVRTGAQKDYSLAQRLISSQLAAIQDQCSSSSSSSSTPPPSMAAAAAGLKLQLADCLLRHSALTTNFSSPSPPPSSSASSSSPSSSSSLSSSPHSAAAMLDKAASVLQEAEVMYFSTAPPHLCVTLRVLQARLHLATATQEEGLQQAINKYKQALQLGGPNNPAVWAELAEVFFFKASSAAASGSGGNPGCVVAGELCLRSALRFLKSGQTASPASCHMTERERMLLAHALQLRLARSCYFTKRYVPGLAAAKAAEEEGVASCAGYFLQGLFYRKSRKWAEAYNMFDLCIARGARDSAEEVQLNRDLAATADYEGARLASSLLAKQVRPPPPLSISVDGGFTDTSLHGGTVAMARFNRAQMLIREKKMEEAKHDLLLAAAAFPTLSSIRYQLGTLFAKCGSSEADAVASRRQLARAVYLQPNRDSFWKALKGKQQAS